MNTNKKPKPNGIKKLKSGRWQARYFAGLDTNGNRIYPAKSFLYQDDAIKWRNERIHEKQSGLSIEAEDLTVDKFLDRWLDTMADRCQPNTMVMFRASLRLYVRPRFGAMKLQRVKSLDIVSWQSDLLARLSAKTVQGARTLFSMALKDAVSWDLIARNPISKAGRGPKIHRVEMKSFDQDQARRFLDVCLDDKWGLFFAAMLQTGFRPEEGQGLCWSRVNLNDAKVTIHQALVTSGHVTWAFQSPKTKHSKRTIGLTRSLIARFQEHRRRQLEEKMAVGAAYQNHDLVFANPIGEPVKRQMLYWHFKKTLVRAGLPDMRLYDLRHSFVTLSLLAGIDAKTVSADAGHASVAFTLDHYGHVLEAMRESATAKREELFGKPRIASAK